MVSWECPIKPREASGIDPEAVHFTLLDRVGPVEINLVAYVAPVFAAIGGWLVLGEQLGGRTVVGFGAIVLGFVLVKRDAIRAEIGRP